MTDGMTIRHVHEHIARLAMNLDTEISQSDVGAVYPRPVLCTFAINPELQRRVETGSWELHSATNSTYIKMVDCLAYGVSFMKDEQKCNPKSFMQLVIQLAFYRLYGNKPAATYEPVSTANFCQGRIEVCRVVTEEVIAFCSAMTQEPRNKAACCSLFHDAVQAHQKVIDAALKGQGIDRHFLALRRMVRDNEPVPALFEDALFRRSSCYKICTTTLATGCEEIGFYPIVEGGWGISFLLRESR
ncbi:hypothetical protein AJ79_09777 [Helicocarpus griseus UAMH5409]|uniref:Choline/carnitine acyltransferase domain-containing protein n=1 Tax=Helicocarpus griseus UAMH5409 TaxID=1447875 RepID=A0A2B7WH47_9EURO|nr:hypothetical protein AJ79_09777 [Helicocarpus griseus UAMH5409]